MPSLSVIVPALDEAEEIEATLRQAGAALGPDVELIVVDGGSRDETAARAAAHARVLASAPGRGRQMNAGARAAQGDVLLFLHADTHLQAGARDALERALADARVVGGAFRFALRGPLAERWGGRALTAWIRARCRLFGSATGDQAIFARRTAFDAVGGYASWPLFEDLDLYRSLKKVGRVVELPVAAATSDRRWRRRGLWRTMLVHAVLRAGYHAGADPSRLAAWYRSR